MLSKNICLPLGSGRLIFVFFACASRLAVFYAGATSEPRTPACIVHAASVKKLVSLTGKHWTSLSASRRRK
ncbi:TPA_asm: MC053.1R [Molluscum contagiosum virus]|nr:TPA_asm: MC053.1R [Molluscum contagiosum virus]DBA37488.1 TPA_asm: MC053.1R [Molluscum contagiosum virus]DBA38385.1 TPA_asm: MC053.1R [Molluscum contagiosum virus]DBA38565.1 TPA_asm: MC053.1R [Molluscum contagiosum virus]DBA38745.1 TPA_asm: MC053.1R [Molluscum contagiosum virus]